MFSNKYSQTSLTNKMINWPSLESIVPFSTANSSLRNYSQWVIVLTEGVILEYLKAKNSPMKPECLENILDYGALRLNQAVKMQLLLMSFWTLSLCYGNLVTARIDFLWFCQSWLTRGWLLSVHNSFAVILSKIVNIFRKWRLYFYYFTYCSLIILASNVIPTYTFLGFCYSTLQISCFINSARS